MESSHWAKKGRRFKVPESALGALGAFPMTGAAEAAATRLRTGGPEVSSEVLTEVEAMASTFIWLPRASAIFSKLSMVAHLPEYCVAKSCRREKNGVANLPAQHVEYRGAFIDHHGLILGRKGHQPARFGDGSGAFIHQRTNREIVEGLIQGCFAGCLFDVKGLAVARQSIGQPGVRGGCGHDLIAPPLGGRQIRQAGAHWASLSIPAG